MLKSSQSVTLDASHYELIEAMTDEVVILDATGKAMPERIMSGPITLTSAKRR